jgi:hypothetical protein
VKFNGMVKRLARMNEQNLPDQATVLVPTTVAAPGGMRTNTFAPVSGALPLPCRIMIDPTPTDTLVAGQQTSKQVYRIAFAAGTVIPEKGHLELLKQNSWTATVDIIDNGLGASFEAAVIVTAREL